MSALSEYPYHTINHNLRLYILSFLSNYGYNNRPCDCYKDHGYSNGGCPKHDYGYFLSDPTRTIYRISYMHSFVDINLDSKYLTHGGYFSGTKSITLYFDLDRLSEVEQKVRRFIQYMCRQTIILRIHIPLTIEATDQLMSIIVNQSWPKNVAFSIAYDYNDDRNDDWDENDHQALF
jgi:hypothetical protein